MGKITTLTEEHKAQIPEWVEKWKAIGMDTTQANFETSKEAVLKAYELCKLPPPKQVLFADSPLHGARMGIEITGDKSFWSSDRGGQYWAGWCSYVSFFRDVMGWDDPILSNFDVDETLTLNSGWIFWHEDVAIICNRPNQINLDEEGRLHCEDGPSVSYRDGWSLYRYHGVTVPKYVIEEPWKITVDLIESEENVEVRRVMIERYDSGDDGRNYLMDTGATLLDTHPTGNLFTKEMVDDEDITMLQVVNSSPEPDGSFKKYYLRVPPTITKAKDAVAWTFGMTPESYSPQQES